MLVRFRWLNSRGDVVQRAKDYSPTCRQTDVRPNLLVRSIGVQPADRPARRRYVVFVRNAGGTVADASSLLVTVNGAPLPLAPVAELDPGEGVLVTVEGPALPRRHAGGGRRRRRGRARRARRVGQRAHAPVLSSHASSAGQ